MRKIGTLILAIAGFSTIAQTDVMTPELLWKLGRVSLETVSPDGKSFIYGVTNYNIDDNKGNRDLYSMTTDGGAKKQLTDMAGSEYGAHYLMDGKKIGYSHNGQFHIMNADGTESKQLTEIEGGIANVKAYELKDGRIALLFTKSVKMEKTTADLYPNLPKAEAYVIDDLMYRHWDSWSDAEYNHLCIAYANKDLETISEYQDLMAGEKYDAPVNPFGGSESFDLSPDGNIVVYESKKKSGKEWAVSTNSELYMLNLESGEKTIITEGMEGYDKEPKFSPDGSKLAWMSMKTPGYESDVNDIVIHDMASGNRMHVLVAAGEYDKTTFQSYGWADERTIYAGVPTMGTNQIYKVSLPRKIEKGGKLSLSPVSKGTFNYNHFEVAGKSLIVDRQDMNHATEVYKVDIGNGKTMQLTHVNDEVYSTLKTGKI